MGTTAHAQTAPASPAPASSAAPPAPSPQPPPPPPAVVTPLFAAIKPWYGDVGPQFAAIKPWFGDVNAMFSAIKPWTGGLPAGQSVTQGPFSGPSAFAPLASGAPGYGFYAASGYDPFWGGGANSASDTGHSSITGWSGGSSEGGNDHGSGDSNFWSGGSNPYLNNPSKYVTYAAIGPFWQGELASFSALMSNWSSAKSPTDYTAIASQLNGLITTANAFWGKAVSHPESAYWGGGEWQNGQQVSGSPKLTVTSIANTLLSAQGVKFTPTGSIDPTSLAGISQTNQAMFFVNFYDQLMSYSGTDHVDWWMGAANWTPAMADIAASVGNGQRPITVGMLDFTATNGTQNDRGTIVQLGSDQFGTGHGAAVEGLIAGSVDGSGIMGVMPKGSANVVVYDPYDATGTTNWASIASGIDTLTKTSYASTWGHTEAGASIINASLGVSGWTLNPGWNTVFTSTANLASGQAHNAILVVAAGNDGLAQTANVPWNFAINPTLLIVGSINGSGTISNFSNTPGSACLTATTAAAGACTTSLASRYIVAPGELILISDNAGNISRQTGTSLAAPLVSGAVGLLEARWPWLAKDPTDTANIILQSATKLGSKPGADPVYGAGLLNIQASQSPLNWANVTLTPVINGQAQTTKSITASALMTSGVSGTQSTWNAQNLYYVAIEKVGSTFRDFQIPLSSNLVGQTVGSQGGTQQFQSYLGLALQSWVKTGSGFESDNIVQQEMSGFLQSSTPVGRAGDMEIRLSMTPNAPDMGFTQSNLPYKTEMALVGRKTTVRFGVGQGAQALSSQPGFDQSSDYKVSRGGANPLLGLASGGGYLAIRQQVSSKMALDFGMTERRDLRDPTAFGLSNAAANYSATIYEASAEHAGVDLAPTANLTLHASVTQLHENAALLGIQSTNASDLGQGSNTTGVSFGFDAKLPLHMTVSATALTATTKTSGTQGLHTMGSGIGSSASEIALSKSGVFSKTDRLRLAVAQALQATSGQIGYDTYGVVDRQTGTLGIIHEAINAGTARTPVSVELLYGRMLPTKGSEISVYMRAGTDAYDASIGKPMDYLLGAKFRQVF